jgi:hypothetical protein
MKTLEIVVVVVVDWFLDRGLIKKGRLYEK